MASHPPVSHIPTLDGLFSAPARIWPLWLALGLPWFRVEIGPWSLYPLALGCGVVLMVMVLREGSWTVAVPALLPGLGLGAVMGAMALWRGQFAVAAMTAGVTGLHFFWGAAAYRFGLAGGDHRSAGAALVRLPAYFLAAGAVSWLFQAVWPPGCLVWNCDPGLSWPYPFLGGFHSSGQYLLGMLFAAPGLGVALFLALDAPRAGRAPLVLAGLAALAGLGLIAGAPGWAVAAAALATGLLSVLAFASGRPGGRLLAKGAVFGFVFGCVFVYGLAPEYWLARSGSGAGPDQRGAPLLISLPEPPPRSLSSGQFSTILLRVVNTGWRTLGREGNPMWIGARLHVSPERGGTRIHDSIRTRLPVRLKPGAEAEFAFPIRLPHWFSDGYLAWRVMDASGRPVPLHRNSHQGFRVTNAGYHALPLDPDNRLSILTGRSRAFLAQTDPAPSPRSQRDSWNFIIGSILDTALFSPFWGRAVSAREGVGPLSPSRPFLPDVFRQYGLLGVLLAGWFGWRLLSRAASLALKAPEKSALGWRIVAVTGAVVAFMAMVSPAVGSYHAHWAFFLLAGYAEGSFARINPRQAPGAGIGWRMRIPIPRFPRIRRFRRFRRLRGRLPA